MAHKIGLIGICICVAFVISGLSAQSATALRWYTCSDTAAVKDFSNATCSKKETPKTFGHTAIPVGELTVGMDISTTALLLKGTHAGVKLAVKAAEVTGTNNISNLETTEAYAHGEGSLIFEGVTVTEPAGKGCKVKGGSFTSNKLETTTLKQGEFLLFQPASGTVIAEFTVEGCSVSSLNTTYQLDGSFKGVPSGATIALTHTEITAQGTLTLGGLPAGIELLLDIKDKKIGGMEPLKFTSFT